MLKTLPKGKIVIHKFASQDYPEFITETEVGRYKKNEKEDVYECKVIIQEVVVNDFSEAVGNDDQNEVYYFVEPYEEYEKKNIYNDYVPLRILAFEEDLTNPNNEESDE
jgi:hypothetical protein